LAGSALSRDTTRRENDIPFPILGHGILVFLSKKTALNQDVEAGRVVAAARLAHVKVDRAGDLLAAKDELGFLLALRLGTPDRHRDGHEHQHDTETDEQRSHRVSALTALTTL
jgi:hypothetical protein